MKWLKWKSYFFKVDSAVCWKWGNWKNRETSWKTIIVIPPWGNQGCKRMMEEHGAVKWCSWVILAQHLAKLLLPKPSSLKSHMFLIYWIQFILLSYLWPVEDVVVECHSPNRWSSGPVNSLGIKPQRKEITCRILNFPDLL